MTTPTDTAPIFARPNLENSLWYGSALINSLATAAMTGGHYALLRWRMQKGFTPPAPHRHGPEDFYIIRGQLRFWVAGEELVATDGDFVRTPPGIWHTFQVESDEAEFLIIFSPAGMETFFQTLGRPAEAMELPAGRVGPPDPERLRALAPRYGAEFSPPGTTPQDMRTLP
ncbi:MAG: cupin domain-containing protein [Thermomicrobiales bacterium]